MTADLALIWPELILTIGGLVTLLLGTFGGDRQVGLYQLAALITLAAAAAAVVAMFGTQASVFSNTLEVDAFGGFAKLLIYAASFICILIAPPFFKDAMRAEYPVLILFATLGMGIMASARDLMTLYVGLELNSLAAYVLASFMRSDDRSSEAGLKYFVLGALASGMLLYGISLLYGFSGTTQFAGIAQAMGGGMNNGLLFGLVFVIAGLAFKISAVPFHMWTPDVYEGAPAPVTAFMSATVKAAAFIAFARVFLVAFNDSYTTWFPILWWLAAITMVSANLIALVQTNVKRMLAYSSIAHGGYLLLALTAANPTATAGMLFYLLVYTLMNIGAFAIVISVAHQAEERQYIDDYTGFGWTNPALGVFLTIFLLSLAGFPGTGGFMGKIYLLQGAAESELWWLMVILVLTTVASYWYYLRVAWLMWMKNPTSDGQHDLVITPFPMRLALVVCVGLIVYTGIFPGAALEFARASVQGLGAFGGGIVGLAP
ncbi:MAG TPA: NADH-quinone oxidoreductase subunit N [Gemmatimonadetes bacterium]|nr:NADH-quinone oxidoreductase subunit N [Gemmatimonadota bacterium]